MLESKRRALIFLIIALLLAAISGYLILQKVQELNNDLGTTVQIYVASTNIGSREFITEENITTDEIPRKYLRDDHITSKEELLNKVSVVPLEQGDIITKNMLKPYSIVTNENNRLIALLASDRIFFDQANITDNDRVDIIVSHSFEAKPVTEVFMRDVMVAAYSTKDDRLAGILVEVPFEKVAELIHMQNYADSLRIVKTNVGQPNLNDADVELEEDNDSINESPSETTPEAEVSEETNPAEENGGQSESNGTETSGRQ